MRLFRYIHVRYIKQPQSISLKFFMLFLNSQGDLLDDKVKLLIYYQSLTFLCYEF